jgi:hypothetical protein
MGVTLTDLQETYSSRSSEDLLSLHRRGTLTDLAYSALEAELVRRGGLCRLTSSCSRP